MSTGFSAASFERDKHDRDGLRDLDLDLGRERVRGLERERGLERMERMESQRRNGGGGMPLTPDSAELRENGGTKYHS